jgi:FMN-dependent NADH-azoreductase
MAVDGSSRPISIGLTDATFIHARKIAFGPDARAAALSGAKQKIGAVVAHALATAA